MSQGNAPCDIFFYGFSKKNMRESLQMTFTNHTKAHFIERQASRLSFQATLTYPIHTMALRRKKIGQKQHIFYHYNIYK